jgi:hypothetical protein
VDPAFFDEVDIVRAEFAHHRLALLSLKPLSDVRVTRIGQKDRGHNTIPDFDFELF